MGVDTSQLFPLIDTLTVVASDSVVPVVRIPLTASSWLGVNTSASAANMAKYPDLNVQYQNFVGNLVKEYTEREIVTILDLHWTDDDTDNAPMAGKGATNCVDFWDSVASIHGSNPYVFYELYNEPHRVTQDQWMNGDSTTSGMLEMLEAVRKHTSNPVIIAGYGGYAYDSDSLIALDGQLNGDKMSSTIFTLTWDPTKLVTARSAPSILRVTSPRCLTIRISPPSSPSLDSRATLSRDQLSSAMALTRVWRWAMITQL